MAGVLRDWLGWQDDIWLGWVEEGAFVPAPVYDRDPVRAAIYASGSRRVRAFDPTHKMGDPRKPR